MANILIFGLLEPISDGVNLISWSIPELQLQVLFTGFLYRFYSQVLS